MYKFQIHLKLLILFDSLTKFVEDADDDCVRIVDSLLDVLTKGQHTLTKKQLEMVSLAWHFFIG